MREGLIAPGVVDERSIEDVCPDDLKGFVQCHFFAGIGIWSLALRLAGWPDNRAIWTGSCPCQPFSAAGKGNGFADERHLWPAFHWLIDKHRPVTVVGEQVASADGLHWLDLVSSDMEGTGYAFGALDTCAAGFSAPHIRQRLYWLGHSIGARLEGYGGDRPARGRNASQRSIAKASIPVRLADAMSTRRAEWRSRTGIGSPAGVCGAGGMANTYGGSTAQIDKSDDAFDKQWTADRGGAVEPAGAGATGGICGGDDSAGRSGGIRDSSAGRLAVSNGGGRASGGLLAGQGGSVEAAPVDDGHSEDGRAALHPLNYWADADWLLCRDPDGPRFRPVEPGAFPLVDAGAVRNRLAAVRGAGNAINLAQAQGFIEAAIEVIAELGA